MEKNKTAMQKLIHDFKHGKFNGLTPTQTDNLLNKYLDKEKQQIMHAYGQGVADEAGEILDVTTDSEYYYNETYGTSNIQKDS